MTPRPSPRGSSRQHLPTLLLLGVGEAALLGLLAWWPGPGMPWPGLLFFYGAFAAYLLAWVRYTPNSGTEPGGLAGIWAVGILLRVVLLPVAPELSDDVYRYLWDGHVQINGVNPYLYAPSDPVLSPIRTAWHSLINNPDIPTIYGPVAQMSFLLIALVGGGILQAKLLWLALDLATAWLLVGIARRTDRNPARVLLLYLWCPLLVVETAWSAHLEPLGLLAMVLVLHLTPRSATAGLALAGAALTKFAPAAALPPLARRLGFRFVAAFGFGSAVAYLPFIAAGPDLWEGLFVYARDWRFMVGPFALIETLLQGRWTPRIVAAVVVVTVIAYATWKRFSVERSLFWILGAGILLSPTVHPWYVLWILPFAALRESGPWLLLCGLVFLGYWGLGSFLENGLWPQPVWLRILVWAPPLIWIGSRFAIDSVRGPGPGHAGNGQRQIAGPE